MSVAPVKFFRTKQWRRTEGVLLLLILLLAAFLRIWRLEDMPPGFYHDEAYNGLDALSLVQGKQFPQFYEGWELYAQDAHAGNPPEPTRFPIFFEGNYGREPVHIYLIALSIKLWGATPFAVRLVPALAGVAAVLTTFLAAKILLQPAHEDEQMWRVTTETAVLSYFYQLTPLFAALTLAILFPAIHFSRFGLRAMLFVPVETLATACFWQGILRKQQSRIPSWLWLSLAGFWLGFGVYVYAAARLFPLLFAAFILIWFWRDKTAVLAMWRSLSWMVVVAVITAVPLLLFFARYPYFFLFRIGYVANKGAGVVAGKPWLTWLLNVGRVVRGFFWQGETHLRHNLPGRPYLDWFQAIFFLMGFMGSLLAVLRKKTWTSPYVLRLIFLFLWLVVMLLPSIMSGDAPHFGRLTGAAPVAAIFVGMGIAWLVFALRQRFAFVRTNRLGQLLLVMGVVGILSLSLFLSVYDYFGRYAGHPDVAADFYLPDWELGEWAARQPADTRLYLTPTQEEMATIFFALAAPERMHSYAGAEGAIPAGVPGSPSMYFIRPDDQTSLENLQAYFPGGERGRAQHRFLTFSVSAQEPRLAALTSIDSPVWGEQLRLVGWSLTPLEGQLHVKLAWQAVAPMSIRYTAFVHLVGDAGLPLAQADRPPGGYPTPDWQTGEIVVDTFVIEVPQDLPAGMYSLQTGFYDLATLERLGTAVLTEIDLP